MMRNNIKNQNEQRNLMVLKVQNRICGPQIAHYHTDVMMIKNLNNSTEQRDLMVPKLRNGVCGPRIDEDLIDVMRNNPNY